MTAVSLHTRAICDACPAPATVEIESGFFLCDSCAGTLTDFIAEISVAPVSSFPGVKVPTVSSAPIPVAVGTLNSVSPGEMNSSLPSGESDPSVMLDCAPGEFSSCGAPMGGRLSARGEYLDFGSVFPPQDSIPLPVHTPQPIPPAPETFAAPTAKVPAVPPFSLRDPGPCGMDLDAEAARLEELWTHLGILAPLTLPSRHHGGAA